MIPLSRPVAALSASTSTRPRPLAWTHSVKPEKLIPRPAADVGTLVHFRRRISNRILFSKALDTREVGRRAVLVATAMLVGLGGRTHAASGMDSGKWSGTQIRMETLAEAVARLRSGARSFPMARYPDPILRRVAKPVAESAFQSPEDLNLLGRALEVAARTEGAVGLAASQVGVNARMIFLDQDVLGKAAPRILVNPRITERSSEGDMRWWRECCLVLPPDVLVTLLRDATVSVEYFDIMGRLHTQSLEGEAARALQHELDHLNGVLILDHATDDEDLDSKMFPALKSLESPDHARRQQAVFDRMGF